MGELCSQRSCKSARPLQQRRRPRRHWWHRWLIVALGPVHRPLRLIQCVAGGSGRRSMFSHDIQRPAQRQTRLPADAGAANRRGNSDRQGKARISMVQLCMISMDRSCRLPPMAYVAFDACAINAPLIRVYSARVSTPSARIRRFSETYASRKAGLLRSRSRKVLRLCTSGDSQCKTWT